MAHRDKNSLVRLEALNQRPARLSVDRTHPGRIRGASLITTGPAAGHGFEVDWKTVEQVTQFAQGLRGRWTHSRLSADGLGRHLGRWERVKSESFWLCRGCEVETGAPLCQVCGDQASLEWRSVGDFAFDPSAHRIRPDGLDVPAPVYLMDRAEEDPSSLGISVVAHFEFEEEPALEGEAAPARLARIASRADLRRGDWVADPAANPIGLHAHTDAPSELTEGALQALDRVVARVGKRQAKARALAFLARYFGDAFEEVTPVEVAPREGEPVASGARALALERELTELRRVVQGYRQAERAREEAAGQALLTRLRQESAELQAPIPAEDLAHVQSLLQRGDLETAKLLGEAYLARSRAAKEEPFARARLLSAPCSARTGGRPR